MEVEVRSPFPFEAIPRIWRWIEPFRGKVSDDFSPQTLDAFVAGMAAKWDNQMSWAVYVDGELGGLITFERLSPWLGTAHCIFKPEFQGRGVAVKACREAAAQIFETGIGKLAFYPLEGNLAIFSLLVNLGARREGRLEGHTLCDGRPKSVCVYGLLKGAFENACRNSSRNVDIEPGRSGSLDNRVGSVGEAQDEHQHQQHHADDDAGNASADGPLEPVLDGQPQ